MPNLKLKLITLKDTYTNNELAAVLQICMVLNMPMFELTSITDMVNYINGRLLDEYAPPGKTEFDTDTGIFL